MTAIPIQLLVPALGAILRLEGAQRIEPEPLFHAVRRELAKLEPAGLGDDLDAFAELLDAPETAAMLAPHGISLWQVEESYRVVDHRPPEGAAAQELLDRDHVVARATVYGHQCRFCRITETEASGQLIRHDYFWFHERCAESWEAAKLNAAAWRADATERRVFARSALFDAIAALARGRGAVSCSMPEFHTLLLEYIDPEVDEYWRNQASRVFGILRHDDSLPPAMHAARAALWLAGDDVRLVDLRLPSSAEEARARISRLLKGNVCRFCGLAEVPHAQMQKLTTGPVHPQCVSAWYQWTRAASAAGEVVEPEPAPAEESE